MRPTTGKGAAVTGQRPASIRAVVFDVFGTLVEIGSKRWPFAKLVRAAANPRWAKDALLTHPLGLQEAAQVLGCRDIQLSALAEDLSIELASVTLYPEVAETMHTIRARGLKIGIASNLAAPYADPVMRLLPIALDAYGWSFQVGFAKPHPAHYQWVCKQLQVAPAEALMVGDTLGADFHGARAAGLQAVYLDRSEQIMPPDIPTIRTLDEILVRL